MKAIELNEKERARVGVAWVQGYRDFKRDAKGRLVANYRSERKRLVPDPLEDDEDSACLRVWLVHKHYRVATETTMGESRCEVGHPSNSWSATFLGGTGGLIDPDGMERAAIVMAALKLLPAGTLESLEVEP